MAENANAPHPFTVPNSPVATRAQPPAIGGDVAGRFVGRAAELAAIGEEIGRAWGGAPRAVLLAGEAGIGKSRLLAASLALTKAADRAFILVGRCVDERGMPPYFPWFDAFADRAGPRAAATARASDTSDLRELRALLAGGDPEEGRRDESLSPEQRKLRLFEAVTACLAQRALNGPVVVALDDLQWSDAASNELLRYLLIHAPPAPLLVLGAYRSEEAAANPDLTRTIEDLHRRRLLTIVPVGPLSADELGRVLGGLAPGRGLEPALVAAIHAHAEGNPFFAEEVVRVLVEEGRLAPAGDGTAAVAPIALSPLPLPRAVAALIERRLAKVGGLCRAALEAAALVGREIAVDLVAPAIGAEAEEVAGLFGEAAGAALVRALPADGPTVAMGGVPADFAFLHDRVRETIAAGINPVRRRALHDRIAGILEGLPGPPDDFARLAALVYHFRMAREPSRTAAYAVRLGDAAMRAHAHAEAARAYGLAVDLSAAGDGAGGLPTGELLLRLGEAALAAGGPTAVDAFAAARDRFAAAGDRLGVARAGRRLGVARARREELAAAVAELEEALRTLETLGRPGDEAVVEAEQAEVLIELTGIRGLSLGDYDGALASGRRGLELAIRSPAAARASEPRARLALAHAYLRCGRLADGASLLPAALERALALGDHTLGAEIAGALANYHYWVGDLDASEQAAVQRRELAERGGDPYALRHAVPWLAFLAGARGEWDEAARLLAEAAPQVARVDSPEPRAFLRKIQGFVLLMQGAHAEATAALEEAVAGFRPSGPATLVWYLGCLATAYQAAGEQRASEGIAAETAALVDALPPGSLPQAPALAELGVVAVLRGDRAAAACWYPRLLPFAGQLHWVLTDRVLGMLAALLGDQPAADRHFADAAALARRGGIRPELGLTLAEQGAARRQSPEPATRASAEPLLREALDLLRGLRMSADAARVAAMLRQPGGRPPPRRELPAGLSEREAEVLAMVVQGLTNRQIGARLGISEKTVTNHLTHIFTKADLDNRAAAVAFALRHGLA